jgi:hypothetical protein
VIKHTDYMNMLVKIRQSFRVPDGFGVANQERSMRRERERERDFDCVEETTTKVASGGGAPMAGGRGTVVVVVKVAGLGFGRRDGGL